MLKLPEDFAELAVFLDVEVPGNFMRVERVEVGGVDRRNGSDSGGDQRRGVKREGRKQPGQTAATERQEGAASAEATRRR